MEAVRRVRILAVIAIAFWLFAVAKMVAFGTTGGQFPLLIGMGLLLIAYAVRLQVRSR